MINFEIKKDVHKLNRILFLGGFEGADGVNRKFSENQTKPAPYLVDLSFIDYSKAFDKVRHEKLFNILEHLDIDGKDLRVIRNLYWDQSAAVRIGGEHID